MSSSTTPPPTAQAVRPPAHPDRAAPAAASPRSAGRDLASQLRFWLVALAGLALDLWSKDWAFRTLGLDDRRELIPGVLELRTMMNDGALFGIGGGRTTLFVIASLLALVLVLWMFAQSAAHHRFLHIAFGAILAGAAGNMYDRMFVRLVAVPGNGGRPLYFTRSESADGQEVILREYPHRPDGRRLVRPAAAADDLPRPVGYVRDFIKIPTKVFGDRDLWPWVFNVADALLVGGVGLLAVRVWRERGSRARRGRELDSAAASA